MGKCCRLPMYGGTECATAAVRLCAPIADYGKWLEESRRVALARRTRRVSRTARAACGMALKTLSLLYCSRAVRVRARNDTRVSERRCRLRRKLGGLAGRDDANYSEFRDDVDATVCRRRSFENRINPSIRDSDGFGVKFASNNVFR